MDGDPDMCDGYVDYAIVIEQAEASFGAYVRTCRAVSPWEIRKRKYARLSVRPLNFTWMGCEDGEPIPPPSSRVEYVKVPVAA